LFPVITSRLKGTYLRIVDLTLNFITANKNIEILLEELKYVRDQCIKVIFSFSYSELIKQILHLWLQKQMRVVNMDVFVAENDDHHIAKIQEIINWQN